MKKRERTKRAKKNMLLMKELQVETGEAEEEQDGKENANVVKELDTNKSKTKKRKRRKKNTTRRRRLWRMPRRPSISLSVRRFKSISLQVRKSDRGRARQISARLTRAFLSSNARSHAHAAYFTSSLLCFFTELT